MTWLLLGFFIFVFLFGFVVMFGAPYLPTMRKQIESGLDLLDLKSGQTMLELGCGDGRVLIAAAKRGWRVVGYELNPILVIVCRLRSWKYRRNIDVRWGDFWSAKWPETEGIFVFLLPHYMQKLDKKITQWNSGKVKLVSFAFKIPGKQPLSEKDGLYLYEYK